MSDEIGHKAYLVRWTSDEGVDHSAIMIGYHSHAWEGLNALAVSADVEPESAMITPLAGVLDDGVILTLLRAALASIGRHDLG